MKVLISTGFGAGWSTWNNPKLAYDKRVVKAFEDGASEDEMKELCKQWGLTDAYDDLYMGGYSGIKVVEVPKGSFFQITEYDGAEDIQIFDKDEWIYANE